MNRSSDKIIEILNRPSLSPLYLWMSDEFSVIEMNRKRYGNDWQALCDLAIEYGIMAGRRKKPTAKIVRQTYYRVRARQARSISRKFNQSSR